MGSCGTDSRQRYSREEEYCLLDYFPHKQLLIADFYTSKHLRRGVSNSGRFWKPAVRPQLLMSHQWRTFNVRREFRSHLCLEDPQLQMEMQGKHFSFHFNATY